mmetsp:Transcript_127033/g.359532  ORF Transcript_127033/g.359532 Transcript_127033/m.359532 type:complete len:264 (+) Transcript_127033:42-833(+)
MVCSRRDGARMCDCIVELTKCCGSRPTRPKTGSSLRQASQLDCWTCSAQDIDTICRKAAVAIAAGKTELALLVLPGSFNPVHSEHVQSLRLARDHLAERTGAAVVGGFLQPSSDHHVASKLGRNWAMSLADRIEMCELAAEADARSNADGRWIHTWRSGTTNGFAVPGSVAAFFNARVAEKLGSTAFPLPVTAYMAPPGPAPGWSVARGDTKPVSSTRVRGAIENGRWEELAGEGCAPDVVAFLRSRYEAGALFLASGAGCRA